MGKSKCPLCDEEYKKGNDKSSHHIYFPKKWYRIRITVPVCETCHKNFHSQNSFLLTILKRSLCLQKWIEFCEENGKNPFIIYPELKT